MIAATRKRGEMATMVKTDNVTEVTATRVIENGVAMVLSIVSKSLENRFNIRPMKDKATMSTNEERQSKTEHTRQVW
jgi:hypothetical protein